MRTFIRFVALLALFSLSRISSFAQPILTVAFPGTNLDFTAEQFAALPHADLVAVDPHEQKEHHYSVVAVRELLARTGAPLGEKLRGAALRDAVLVRARDGYAVAFTLADFDESFSQRTIGLADREDGNPLSEKAGPLRLIVPGDKKAVRWARMVSRIEIFDADAKR